MGRFFRVCTAILHVSVYIIAVSTVCYGSSGDISDAFQSCLRHCQLSGCPGGGDCIPGCARPANETEPTPAAAAAAAERPLAEPWDLALSGWTCGAECRYRCMVEVEGGKQANGGAPEKYYGKWPFRRVLGLQEPAAVAFSAFNFLATAYGLAAFRRLVLVDLTRRPDGSGSGAGGGPLYEYTGLWTVHGLLSLHSWLWSALFHARDVKLTERWDYSSAVSVLGFALVLAIIRTASLRLEAPRVMVSAPIVAFVATHILYLNFYDFDYGLNMKVCVAMGAAQLLLWAAWAGATRHVARAKLWATAAGTAGAALLEVFDFPPLLGALDAHALWHLATVPLSLLWWSFACDDARARTAALLRRGPHHHHHKGGGGAPAPAGAAGAAEDKKAS